MVISKRWQWCLVALSVIVGAALSCGNSTKSCSKAEDCGEGLFCVSNLCVRCNSKPCDGQPGCNSSFDCAIPQGVWDTTTFDQSTWQ
jgi:hypothetical protein